MTDLARLTAVLEAEITRWSSGLDAATEQLNEFGKKTTETLQDIAGAFGLYLSADAFVEWGKGLAEQDAGLDRFSQETGIAVEQLSALEFALESGGVSADKMSVIFRDLQKNVSAAAGNAGSDSAIAFKLLGISVTDSTGALKDNAELLSEVADRFQNLQDGANKTAIAVQLFGKNGESLIPTLNKGAQGIADLEDQAAKLGATVSGATAAAAEKLETDVTNLGIAVKEGLGQRILQDLLPALDGLTSSFKTSSDTGKQFDAVATTIADGLKVLAAGALYAVNFVEDTGKAIGALAAAGVAAATGNIKQAGSILTDAWSNISDIDAAFLAKEKALFADPSNLKTYDATLIALNAPNLAAAEAAEKAAEEAIKQLQGFDTNLRQQIAGLQDGGDAAAKYEQRLQDMSKAIAAGGDAGKALAAQIQADIATFKQLSDDKTITKGLEEIGAAIQKLQGDTGDSAVADLDKKYGALNTTLRQSAAAGNQTAIAGLAQFDTLVKLTTATGDYNDDIKQTEAIEKDLGDTLAKLKLQFDEGAIGQSDYTKAVADAQTKAAAQMSSIIPDLQAIAAQTGNPQQLAGIDALRTKITGLTDDAGKAGQALEKSIGNDATNALLEFETGTASAGKAFQDFASGIETEILKLANQKLVDSLFGSLISGTGGGSGAGIFGTLAGLFAGGKASGGEVQPGMAYRINENTPNSEYFVPHMAGSVVPSQGIGGGALQVHQYFSIQAPTGTVSRQTQSQIGAAASRQLAVAAKRNN